MGPGAIPVGGAEGDHGPFNTAQDLFAYTKKNMPLPPPKAGSLSDEEYWAVVAYMLSANGTDIPADGLNADNAASVTIKR
jgi:hypothetical protein